MRGAATRPGALSGIGRTPLVRVSSLTGPDDAEVWVKLEGANPTGSYKDRMALSMIEAAEERGELQPGQTVVEYTGGSTGSSLAFVCAVKGHPLRIVTSDAFAPEKLRTIAAFGARLDVIDSPDGIHPGLIPAMRDRAAEIVPSEGAFPTEQFTNRDALVGYRGIGDEILEQLTGRIDAACAYVGVGGRFIGMTEAVRERWPELLRVVAALRLAGELGPGHRVVTVQPDSGMKYPPPPPVICSPGPLCHDRRTRLACGRVRRSQATSGGFLMRTSIRVAVATALLAPLAAVASTATPAGAAPAPTVSATSGAPGTRVDVSLTGCASDEEAGEFRFLQVLLISGTAPNEVLAGAASSLDGAGTLVVPDWVDAALPAVIEATCQEFNFTEDESDVVTTTYDAVAFDVLAGAGAPTQLTSLSRTELAVGQGFEIDGTGCNLPGAEFGGAAVFSGSDLSGRSPVESISEGDSSVSGGEFQAEVILSNDGIETGASGSSTDGGEFIVDELEVVEHPTDIAPGPYNVSPYCVDDDGVALLYQPKLITVTDDAPIADLDLTVVPGTRTATFAGGSCISGPVQVYVESRSIEELMGDFPDEGDLQAQAPRTRHGASPLAHPTVEASSKGGRRTLAVTPDRSGRSTRALGDDGYVETELDPDPAGAWSLTDDVSFDQGFVYGFALCGDPLADGWLYDAQAAVVDLTPATAPTTVVPVTPPAAAAAPAAAVPGRPTYAG